MPIQLRPELEELIQKDVERGPYDSVSEFVEQAVQMLHEQEEWLAANRSEIASKIEAGYAAAKRGELLTPDQVRQQMDQQKRSWRARQGRGVPVQDR